MLEFPDLRDGLDVFKALASEVRLKLLVLLSEEGPVPMGEAAGKLGLTAGTLTGHVKQLEDCGLVTVSTVPGRQGKLLSVGQDGVWARLPRPREAGVLDRVEIGVGLYFDYRVEGTCGLATTERILGQWDDPRVFAHPDRVHAGIVWMGSGYVEYRIPNTLKARQKLTELRLTFEIGSEAPGINDDWPSEIAFAIAGRPVGSWTSPGDFGAVPGLFTPPWWNPRVNSYGLLKHLTVKKDGTWIDGLKISPVTIDDLALDHRSDLTLRFTAPPQDQGRGGLTLYGRGFGNHNQAIVATLVGE
jgi:predicted transcriptional regulator